MFRFEDEKELKSLEDTEAGKTCMTDPLTDLIDYQGRNVPMCQCWWSCPFKKKRDSSQLCKLICQQVRRDDQPVLQPPRTCGTRWWRYFCGVHRIQHIDRRAGRVHLMSLQYCCSRLSSHTHLLCRIESEKRNAWTNANMPSSTHGIMVCIWQRGENTSQTWTD